MYPKSKEVETLLERACNDIIERDEREGGITWFDKPRLILPRAEVLLRIVKHDMSVLTLNESFLIKYFKHVYDLGKDIKQMSNTKLEKMFYKFGGCQDQRIIVWDDQDFTTLFGESCRWADKEMIMPMNDGCDPAYDGYIPMHRRKK